MAHIVRLDVAVHDAARVAEVERLEQLVDVEADVVVSEGGVQHLRGAGVGHGVRVSERAIGDVLAASSRHDPAAGRPQSP